MNKVCTHVWAVPGQGHIIDQVIPETGLTDIYQRDAASVRAEHPDAVLMTWDDFMAARIASQQTPVRWAATTEEQYHEKLEVLPPIDWKHDGFMVGEPDDHCAATGKPRYRAYRRRAFDCYEVSSRPMTRVEFRTELRKP